VERDAVTGGLLGLGVVLPYANAVPWLAEHGLDVRRLVDEVLAARLTSFLGWDAVVAAGTVGVVAATDGELRRGERLLVAAGASAGASVGLPLYLWLRERSRNRRSP
jgi:hypothetical protein